MSGKIEGHVCRFLAIATIHACALVVVARGADAVALRVMSFNIRNSNAKEAASENNWNDSKFPRRERAVRVINENTPDLLGLQEARPSQVEDLKKALPEYA